MRLLTGRITLRRRSVRHAITDLYDTERRTFLIQYPPWLVVALGLSGVIVFAATGFLGYSSAQAPFDNPVLLLPWLYALQFTLELSIFRDRSLRWRRLVMVGTTLLSIGLLVVAALNSNELQTAIQQFLEHRQQPAQPQGNGFLLRLASNPWTYVLINFVILGIFWLDTARRWIRRALGLSPNPAVDLGLDTPAASAALPRIEDMVSGDLLAAGVLSLALGLLVSPAVISRFATVSGQPGLDWLTSIDIMQTLITLPLGLIILGLAATLNGLGAVGGLDAARARTPSAPLPNSARKAVSQEVSLTVINTLQAALDRRIRAALRALALSLRNILWPLLLLISTAALAVSAELVELYLHDPNKTELPAIITVLVAAALGLIAAVFTVFAAALYLFSQRVATNSLRFLGLVGFIVLLTFWMFSVALSGFNLLLLQINPKVPAPFLPLGLSTYVSLAALLIYGALALRRVMRGSREATDPGNLGDPGAGAGAGS
jgi:hypothetical protein